MLIDWSGEFDTWLNRLIEHADRGERVAQTRLDLVYAELEYLQELNNHQPRTPRR